MTTGHFSLVNDLVLICGQPTSVDLPPLYQLYWDPSLGSQVSEWRDLQWHIATRLKHIALSSQIMLVYRKELHTKIFNSVLADNINSDVSMLHRC